ncbi:MAG: hypothetical protein KF812_13530 [Fimbriimonadaceae bacterium]|nr:hypothetical protein [Fimbriimonadaceae bacterium]
MTKGVGSPARQSNLMEDLEQPAAKKREASGSKISGKAIFSIAASVISVIVLSFAIWSMYSNYMNDPRRAAWTPTLKDVETGEVFEQFSVARGSNMPYRNPKTGKNNLYPVEACYWTKEGKAKMTPTYVILNSTLGKPGKTTCPDCGRTVVMYNPRPPEALMKAAWESEQPKNK